MNHRFAVLVLALALSSCSLLGFQGGSTDPIPSFVQASRTTHAATAERWRAYVLADQTLSPIVRDQLVKLYDDWALSISRAEAYLGFVAAPTTPAPAAPAE